MNEAKFVRDLEELRCHADWHKRYFAERSRKYHQIDYWLKSILGFVALVAAVFVANPNPDIAFAAGLVAAGCAFTIANIIPNFKWDAIVAGFKEEQAAWTKIHQGYEDLLRVAEVSERGEILMQEFQKVREMQKTAALEERNLPRDKKLLDRLEAEVRIYYGIDNP